MTFKHLLLSSLQALEFTSGASGTSHGLSHADSSFFASPAEEGIIGQEVHLEDEVRCGVCVKLIGDAAGEAQQGDFFRFNQPGF